MSLPEFDACLRGFIRANGGAPTTQEDYDDYLAALREEELAARGD